MKGMKQVKMQLNDNIMRELEKTCLSDLSVNDLIHLEGGGIFGSDKSLTEWIYYGIGAIIGGGVQGAINASELRYEADQNTLFGHYGGARP